MDHYIPRNREERLRWAINFKREFADVAAQMNISEDVREKASAACDTVIFAINLASEARLFSKVCHSFRNSALAGKDEDMIHVPRFKMPAVPPALAPPNALGYLQKIAGWLKVQDGYSDLIGARLRIITPSRRLPSRDEAEPTAKLRSLHNSVVRIDWKKRGFKGLIVESKRGDEQEWTEIGRDLASPFIDTRPPLEPGKPEIRYYRLIYIVDDQPYGNYSVGYTQVTTP